MSPGNRFPKLSPSGDGGQFAVFCTCGLAPPPLSFPRQRHGSIFHPWASGSSSCTAPSCCTSPPTHYTYSGNLVS